jgi:hypothetical protein
MYREGPPELPDGPWETILVRDRYFRRLISATPYRFLLRSTGRQAPTASRLIVTGSGTG